MFDIYWNRDFLLEANYEYVQSDGQKPSKKGKTNTDTHRGEKVLDNNGQPTGNRFSFL